LNINAETKLVALLGDPVEHSLSPTMHNAAFSKMGLNMAYLAFKVKKEDMKGALEGLKSLGAIGCNITVPHKETALTLLDEATSEAKALGAVNTVLFKDGKALGYNTDVIAIEEILDSLISEDKEAFLLGAGGAAKASAYALGKRGFKRVWITNRMENRGKTLVEKMNELFPERPFQFLPWGDLPVSSGGLLINATSLGMSSVPWPKGLLERFLDSWDVKGVLDIVYLPGGTTQLIEEAKRRNLKHVPGEEVLLRQGVWAFRLFTGINPEVCAMRSALGL
jgi:shikimate dehydrogenase